MDDRPTQTWKLTPFARTMVNFDHMLDHPVHSPFFRSVETISGLHEEQRRVTKSVNLLYGLTFGGAILLLSAPLPTDAKISAFGLEAPVSVLPQQVIAIALATVFARYITLFSSFILLNQMIVKVLQKEGHESFQFFSARFDAANLWSAMLSPKLVGYRSPKREAWLAIVIFLISAGTVLGHAGVVVAAAVTALQNALQSGEPLAIVFGVIATMIVSLSIFALLFALALPVPYRMSDEDFAGLADEAQSTTTGS